MPPATVREAINIPFATVFVEEPKNERPEGIQKMSSVSRVEIGISGCADVFYGEKAQKFISDNVVKMMEQAIGGIKLTKKK